MLLYGLRSDPDFSGVTARLLVSCPSAGEEEGGLFLLDFAGNRMTKLYAGGCTGFVRAGGRWIVAAEGDELIAFDDRFRIAARKKWRKSDFHGAAALDDGVVLFAETGRNAVGCYDADSLERIGEIRFSPEERDVFHINDIWVEGRMLYVSAFTSSGKWFLDPLAKSGTISAIDLADFRPDARLDADLAARPVAGGLRMPHSVIVHNGRIAYCDSMMFRVSAGGADIQFPGFTRGLAIGEDAVFVGQSRMRHVLRIPHQFSNCAQDAGVHVYLPEWRISRFVPLPVQQVYQIALRPEDWPAGRCFHEPDR